MAFLGVEKHAIVSVGSYGQLKDKVNRYYFEAGMDAMMETLEPEIVLVYSKMPDEIEQKYLHPWDEMTGLSRNTFRGRKK